jgi:hypothetical protein
MTAHDDDLWQQVVRVPELWAADIQRAVLLARLAVLAALSFCIAIRSTASAAFFGRVAAKAVTAATSTIRAGCVWVAGAYWQCSGYQSLALALIEASMNAIECIRRYASSIETKKKVYQGMQSCHLAELSMNVGFKKTLKETSQRNIQYSKGGSTQEATRGHPEPRSELMTDDRVPKPEWTL